MGRMISIRMDSDDMIEALVERLHTWTNDEDTRELFEQYYEHMVEGGCYDGREFDIMSIVDNDYVNNLSIVTREEFEEARDKYIEEQMEADGFTEDNLEEGETLEDLKKQREEVLEQYEEDTPTWDDIEYGENDIEFLEGSYVEAKTDRCLLVSY